MDGKVCEECPVEGYKAVVNVAVVDEVDLGVISEGMV